MSVKKKRILIFTLMWCFIFLIQSFAADVTNDQKKLNQLNSQIKNAQQKVAENKKKEKTLSVQIQDLDKKIDKTEEDLGELSKDLTLTKKQIEIAKADLEKAEQNISNKNDTLNQRLRVMYKNGNIGYAEVLLDSASIVEFFSKLDMVKRIVNHDVNLLAYLKDQRDLVEARKKTLQTQESRMTLVMNNMEIKQQELEQSRGDMSRLKEKIKQDNKELEKQIDELNKYAEKVSDEIRKKQLGGKYVGGKLAWPAPGYSRVTSPFGYRIHPILKTKKFHTGVDIAIPTGKSVVAAGDGTVIHADWLGGYGKVVMVDHGGGIVTLYAHNSSLVVKEGDKVKRGDTISKAGSTGMSTGPHLHFEVRKNGEYTDPIPWVK
ncbi:MAG: murein hydrolase activator EnvC family protein [Bacillota bacterium]